MDVRQAYSKFTHGIAVLMTTLAAFYAVSGDFRAYVGELAAWYSAHVPHLLQPVPALAVALWMWYRNGRQDSGPQQLGLGLGKGASMLLLCALVVGGASGCHHNINSANPKVVFASTLLTGSDSVKAVSSGLLAADEVLDALETSEPEYYASAKAKLRSIAVANDKAIAMIRAAQAGDTSADWQAALIAVVDAAGNIDPSTFGFKNPDSQKAAKLGFASLEAALTAITNYFRKQSGNSEFAPVYYAGLGGVGLADLLAALLLALAKYGPGLFDAIREAIKGNPQQQGETDDAYVARLNGVISGNLDEAAAADKKIEAEAEPGQPEGAKAP